MHIDMPTKVDIERLAAARDPLSVTVYLPTSHVPVDSERNVLQARALFDDAIHRIEEKFDKRTAAPIKEQLDGLLEDTKFWADLGRSLAIYSTPTSSVTFRLPNELEPRVSVSDRFSVVPLLRATTFPQAAYVLAISQNNARLVKVLADGPALDVEVPGLPEDAASSVGLDSISGRSGHNRLQGDEGRKVRLTQYARAVDQALRPLLNGESLPLILAATQPLLGIYRNSAGYAHLAESVIRGNPDDLTDAQLAEAAREILDEIYAAELKGLQETFFERRQNGRGATDLSDLARASTVGAIDTLIVDMNARVAGSVDDDGRLQLGADSDAIEEIARHAISSGARVLAVRHEDMPDQVQAAGILRYAV